MLRIGVKFCGNCNPQLDTRALFSELQKYGVFESWRTPPYDALLIISGCVSDCAERPVFSGRVIVVAGYTVDRVEIKKEDLLKVLREKLNETALR